MQKQFEEFAKRSEVEKQKAQTEMQQLKKTFEEEKNQIEKKYTDLASQMKQTPPTQAPPNGAQSPPQQTQLNQPPQEVKQKEDIVVLHKARLELEQKLEEAYNSNIVQAKLREELQMLKLKQLASAVLREKLMNRVNLSKKMDRQMDKESNTPLASLAFEMEHLTTSVEGLFKKKAEAMAAAMVPKKAYRRMVIGGLLVFLFVSAIAYTLLKPHWEELQHEMHAVSRVT